VFKRGVLREHIYCSVYIQSIELDYVHEQLVAKDLGVGRGTSEGPALVFDCTDSGTTPTDQVI
jgi:hypothetical protein